MGGKGGTPRIGHDPRVGIGVYTSTQGSLSSAINQHLAAGQPRSTLGQTGMSLQGKGKAKGHVPSFFGDSGMEMGMMMSMMAMGFIGQGAQAGAATKKELLEIKKKADLDEKRAKRLFNREQRQLDKIDAEKKRLIRHERANLKLAKSAWESFNKAAPAGTGGTAALAPPGSGLYNKWLEAARAGDSRPLGQWQAEESARLRQNYAVAKLPFLEKQDERNQQKARRDQAKADAERL